MLWIYIATLIPSTLPPFLIGFMIGAWLRFAIDSKTEKSLINGEPRPATWYLFAIVILPFWPLVRFANYLYHFGARQ